MANIRKPGRTHNITQLFGICHRKTCTHRRSLRDETLCIMGISHSFQLLSIKWNLLYFEACYDEKCMSQGEYEDNSINDSAHTHTTRTSHPLKRKYAKSMLPSHGNWQFPKTLMACQCSSFVHFIAQENRHFKTQTRTRRNDRATLQERETGWCTAPELTHTKKRNQKSWTTCICTGHSQAINSTSH